MKNNINEQLKTALAPMDVPGHELNARLLGRIKERKSMTKENGYYKRRIPAAVLVAVCVLVLGSITAVAAYRYMSPANVAANLKDDSLEKAFQGEDAVLVNETQESGGYRITLLGSVAGQNISEYLGENGTGNFKSDRIYTVVAIEHTDGTPMPDVSSDEYGTETFLVSHYIQGMNPAEYNIMSMNGNYSEFVKDGVDYRLIEMDNIEMFADHGIYVGVSSGTFYDSNAYVYDESTGEIHRNESYQGVNALFTLPLNISKADSNAAAAYLEKLGNQQNASEEPFEKTSEDILVDEFMEKLTSENINEYARPIESTIQTCVPDKDGVFRYFYELENGSGGEGTYKIADIFQDGATGICRIIGYSYEGESDVLQSLKIDTVTLNENGTVTFAVYSPIME